MSTFITHFHSFNAPVISLLGRIVWQSSALIIVLFLLDLALRHRVQAAVRYGLWMLLLVKLTLPPDLALPTGLAYWLPGSTSAVSALSQMTAVSVAQSADVAVSRDPLAAIPESTPKLSPQSWLFLSWLFGVLGLSAWLAHRSRAASCLARESEDASIELIRLLDAGRDQLGIRKSIRLKVFSGAGGPAVFGIFQPVILIPSKLNEKLTPAQMRSVLLHELAHIQRGDVWVNCAQSLLQIVYWFHPLLWLANLHIRRVREQVVDERVMIEMKEQAEVYPAALLKVAELAWSKPMLMPGLLGILESKRALKQRLERLIEHPVPRNAKLDFAGFVSILIIALLLLPMAHAQNNDHSPSATVLTKNPPSWHLETSWHSETKTKISESNQSTTLYTRVFKVDLLPFARIIENSSSTTSTTNHSVSVYQNLLAWFRAGGIILDPPKAVFYSDARGNLMIRATLEDFKKIEALLLSALQTNVAKVLIEAKFVAVNQTAADLHLQSISPGRSPSVSDQNVTVTSVSPIESGPGYSVNAVGYVSRKSEARISMLNAGQKTNWLQAVEKVAGCDVLSAPRVSTETGREAKVMVTTAETIDGKKYLFGPTLDVIPSVRDGIIDLDVTAAISEKDPSQTNKPKIRTSEIKGIFSISRRGAAILSGPEFKSPDGRAYYVLISAQAIDPFGYPVDP